MAAEPGAHRGQSAELRAGVRVLIFALILAAAAGIAPEASARVLLRQDAALKLAFPIAAPERRTAFLTEEQVKSAEKDAHAKVESRVWSYSDAKSTAGEETFAYFDTHVVRTMPETAMVVVDGEGRVRFVELLAFHEPDDYLPPGKWLRQLDGRALDGDLFVRRGIRNITGASLTSEALTQAIRRVLAIHRLINAK
ncbi:MAG: FMN-binding protein [Elusimicrobia bacterium]|nr:FMN-binding protein [Elusimicrobiota bacterium]